MHSKTNKFLEFVDFLKVDNILDANEIEGALEFLDGIESVLFEGTFIMGYQGLAYCINGKLTLAELKSFALNNVEFLAQDGDARYFFTQALVEKKNLSKAERMELIHLMPQNYQPFLLKWFVGT